MADVVSVWNQNVNPMKKLSANMIFCSHCRHYTQIHHLEHRLSHVKSRFDTSIMNNTKWSSKDHISHISMSQRKKNVAYCLLYHPFRCHVTTEEMAKERKRAIFLWFVNEVWENKRNKNPHRHRYEKELSSWCDMERSIDIDLEINFILILVENSLEKNVISKGNRKTDEIERQEKFMIDISCMNWSLSDENKEKKTENAIHT